MLSQAARISPSARKHWAAPDKIHQKFLARNYFSNRDALKFPTCAFQKGPGFPLRYIRATTPVGARRASTKPFVSPRTIVKNLRGAQMIWKLKHSDSEIFSRQGAKLQSDTPRRVIRNKCEGSKKDFSRWSKRQPFSFAAFASSREYSEIWVRLCRTGLCDELFCFGFGCATPR